MLTASWLIWLTPYVMDPSHTGHPPCGSHLPLTSLVASTLAKWSTTIKFTVALVTLVSKVSASCSPELTSVCSSTCVCVQHVTMVNTHVPMTRCVWHVNESAMGTMTVVTGQMSLAVLEVSSWRLYVLNCHWPPRISSTGRNPAANDVKCSIRWCSWVIPYVSAMLPYCPT